MTQKSLFTLLFACFVFVNVFAQSLQNKIPKDATFVITVNPSVLNNKFKFSKIKEFDFYKMGMDQLAEQAGPMAGEIKKYIENPAELGVDMMSSFYFFGKMNDTERSFGMLMKIGDQSKLNGLIDTYIAPMMPVEEAGNRKVIKTPEANISWDGDFIAVTSVDMDYDVKEEYSDFKTRKATANETWMQQIAGGTMVNSIASHPKFKLANVNKDDVNFWMDYESFNKMTQEISGAGMDPMAQMMMSSMSWMYEEAFVSAGLNFDRGAVKMNSNYFMNDQMLDIYAKLQDAPFNKKFLKYIPKDNLGYFTFNMSMKNLVDLIKNSDNEMVAQLPVYESMAVESLKGMGVDMTADDMYNLLKGDATFVVTGVKEFEKEVTTYEFDDDFNKKEVKKMKKETLPEFVMMMSHGSKDNVLKLIDLGKQSSMIGEKKGFFQVNVPDVPMDVFMKVDKDMIIVSNNMDVIKKKAKKVFKKKNLIKPADAAKILKSSSRLYWNIPKTMEIIGEMEDVNLQGPEGMMFNMGKDSFKSIEFDTNKKIGNSLYSEMKLNFNNKDMNALEQILNIVDDAISNMMGGGSSM